VRSEWKRFPERTPQEIEGAALEGLVVQHLRAWNAYRGENNELYYWRTRSGLEVDVVLYGDHGFRAIQIKNSGSIGASLVATLRRASPETSSLGKPDRCGLLTVVVLRSTVRALAPYRSVSDTPRCNQRRAVWVPKTTSSVRKSRTRGPFQRPRRVRAGGCRAHVSGPGSLARRVQSGHIGSCTQASTPGTQSTTSAREREGGDVFAVSGGVRMVRPPICSTILRICRKSVTQAMMRIRPCLSRC